eukprot:6429293-Ditylum_brightwellii.AAC.1
MDLEVEGSHQIEERHHNDKKDRYVARKSSNEWSNNDAVRIKVAEASRKQYKLLVVERRKRKRCRSSIRRKRKERLGQDWDGDDDDDDRKYKMRNGAKRVGNTWKANEPEISPLGFISVPEKVWRKELSKGKRDFVAYHNAGK